jgi:hypothetical protein
LHLAVETAAIQTKPACAGYKTLDFPLVRVVRYAQRKRDRRTWNAIAPEFYSEGLVQDVSLRKIGVLLITEPLL